MLDAALRVVARLIAGAALALLATAPAHAAESCARDLPPACLQTLGAGSIPTTEADTAECPAKLDAYRDCIAALVTQQGPTTANLPPLSRAEFGFLSALEAELADNVGRLDAFVEALDLTGAQAVYETDWPPLRTRFFDATDNPAYFAAPAAWLAKTQAFYDDLQTMLTRDDVRFAFRRQATSVLYDRRVAKERFQELVSEGRDTLLPEISAVLAGGG